jgi:hypothetical protein
MTMSFKRIAAVTGWLSLAGAAAGALLGGAFMAGARVWIGGLAALRGAGEDVLFGAVFCGAFGAVLGPVAAWLLMRHVPLWLAIGGTAVGTFAGMLYGVGSAPMFSSAPLLGLLLYPLLGFGASALALRITYRPKRLAVASAEAPARLGGEDPA